MERPFLLTHEPADLSREFSSIFLLRGILDSGEASGQLFFDGVVWGFGPAQMQFCRQIVHHSFTCSIFASKPAPDCNDPVFVQLPHIESGEAPSPSQVILRLLYAPVLEECAHDRRDATFARSAISPTSTHSPTNRSRRTADRRVAAAKMTQPQHRIEKVRSA
jgi:hypothetical protein